MSPRAISPLLACLIAIGLASAAAARSPAGPDVRLHAQPAGARNLDISQRIDINQISMFVTNTGSIAWDKSTFNPGFEYPRLSGKTAVFAAGPWLGAMVGGQVRVAVSEYSDEYGPGAMVGGVPDDPNRAEYKVYKLNRVYANAAERDAALADYNSGAVPHGAPAITVLGDGTLDVRGDQMLWCVFNDADPLSHTNHTGKTLPLGVEVQLTAFAWSSAGPADRTVFLHYKFINKGVSTLQDLHFGMWSDPDLGDASDDLVGCDLSRAMGYAYNATNHDGVYGDTPPAVGFDLLRGPAGSGGTPLGLTAFEKYIGGNDPRGAVAVYNLLRGLEAGSGLPITDPTTSSPTPFMLPGDPTMGTGWLDSYPADRLLLVGSGPVDLAPGQSQELDYAIVVGQGVNRLSSILSLRCDDDAIQAFFDRGFTAPVPDEPVCDRLVNCPRSADNWYQQCAPGGSEFTPGQLAEIARRVDAASLFFDFGADPPANLCAVLDPAAATTPQSRALREFAALQCNVAASLPAVIPAGAPRAFLDLDTPIACSGLTGTTLSALAASAVRGLAVSYVDVGPNPPALEGVDSGLPYWGGGAGYAADLFGSSIPSGSPNAHKVEIRFTGAATGQYAYRYLRTLDSLGYRVFLIQDYVPVPWTIWDMDTHTQLNGAFLEDAGPPPSPNLDSIWDPDISVDGREYVWVMNSAYSGDATPDPAYLTDPSFRNIFYNGQIDFRYVMCPRLTSPGAVIDNGDLFRFTPGGFAPGSGVDRMLLQLASLPPDDPAAVQSYGDIAACLADINAGTGIGMTCKNSTPTLISLVAIDAAPDRVKVTWQVGGSPASRLEVERREAQGGWASMGAVAPDGRGLIVFDDTDVVPGLSYSYRLRMTGAGGDQLLGETSVTVPLRSALGLEGFRPNPAGRGAQLAFSLANSAPATLTLFDVAGRRRFSREVGAMGPGRHVIPLGDIASLPNGLYVLRLAQGGQSVTRRAVAIR